MERIIYTYGLLPESIIETSGYGMEYVYQEDKVFVKICVRLKNKIRKVKIMQIGIRLHDTISASLEERLKFIKEQGFSCAHVALSKVITSFLLIIRLLLQVLLCI